MSVFSAGRPVCAVLNGDSGWKDGRGCQQKLLDQMRVAGIPLEVEEVHEGTNITDAVRDAVSRGCGVVIAGGGDGTLNAVAAGLRDSNIPMGILPIGTLNHLARDLGVPLDAGRAIEALPDSQVERIDLGEVNGTIFLNNSILGLYPAYRAARNSQEKKGRFRFRAILSAVFSVFRRNPKWTVRMNVDGREIVRRTPYILIGNNEHKMEGYQLGTRSTLDGGRLWVYVLRPLSRWGLVRLTLAVLLGRLRKHDDFEIFPATSLRIETRRKVNGVAIDGDMQRMRMPLQYRILPKALCVLAPVQPEHP